MTGAPMTGGPAMGPAMGAAFRALLRRDLRLAIRQGADTALTLGFFLLVATLFSFGIAPGEKQAAVLAPGVLWVTALLAMLLSMDRLFQADAGDGALEQLMLGGLPPTAIVAAKCLAHWLATALPLLVFSPILALLLQLPADRLPWLVLALLLGTPTLVLIGAVGAALVLGARRGGLLLSLLILPLYIPVLIFGVAAVADDNRAPILFLGAMLLGALALAPPAAAAALRQAME